MYRSSLFLTAALVSTTTAAGTLVVSMAAVQAQTYQPSGRVPIADNSLGTQITSSGQQFAVTGGVERGGHRLHSFQDFSVPTGGSVTFANPADRSLILRVTGNVASDVNGQLDTKGANFLLINPQGVVFGPKVALAVGPKFLVSTANSVDLVNDGNRFTFAADRSGDQPLLAVQPGALFNADRFNFAGNNGAIQNYGVLRNDNANAFVGLVGGNIQSNYGFITVPQGDIALGGLSSSGSVGISVGGGQPDQLTYPLSATMADITLNNDSRIRSLGGNVTVSAGNLDLDNSLIGSVVNTSNSPALSNSAVTIKADNVNLRSTSSIGSVILSGKSGNASNINIQTRSLVLDNQSEINSVLESQSTGRAGDVNIQANSIVLNNASQVITSSEVGTSGSMGDVSVTGGDLSLNNKSIIGSSTFGSANASNVSLKIGGDINLNGGSSILSNSLSEAAGSSGQLQISAAKLVVLDGSVIRTDTNAGTLGLPATFAINTKNAGDITLNITGAIELRGSRNTGTTGITSSINPGTVGRAGNVVINAGSLDVRDNAAIIAQSFSQGNSGNITIITSGDVFVGNTTSTSAGTFISNSTGGSGRGGNIDVVAGGSLLLINGGRLTTITQGAVVFASGAILPAAIGDGGNITLRTTGPVKIMGSDQSGLSSGIFNGVGLRATGNGGDIDITSSELHIADGGRLVTISDGFGRAGSVRVKSTQDVLLTGAGTAIVVGSSDQGGRASKAGNVVVNAKRLILDNKATILAASIASNGGNIEVGSLNNPTKIILLRRGGFITAAGLSSQDADSNGGNVRLFTQILVAIPKENSDISASAISGRGGNVVANVQGIFGIQPQPRETKNSDITASSEFGQSGTIAINSPGVDPAKKNEQLPTAPVDSSKQIDRTCSPSLDSSLTVTGRGGHPSKASDSLQTDVVWQDPRAVAAPPAPAIASLPAPATGWQIDRTGRVKLLATADSPTPDHLPSCSPTRIVSAP